MSLVCQFDTQRICEEEDLKVQSWQETVIVKLISETISMPKPQVHGEYSDTDSAVTEHDECGEESDIPVASRLEEPCEEFEGKTR